MSRAKFRVQGLKVWGFGFISLGQIRARTIVRILLKRSNGVEKQFRFYCRPAFYPKPQTPKP